MGKGGKTTSWVGDPSTKNQGLNLVEKVTRPKNNPPDKEAKELRKCIKV